MTGRVALPGDSDLHFGRHIYRCDFGVLPRRLPQTVGVRQTVMLHSVNCRHLRRGVPPTFTLIVALALNVVACATNPATGGRDLVLMSEDSEIALGRELHPQVLKEQVPYDDAKLQAYVRGVGERVAAASDRNNLIYRFTVLDSPEANAFALPGGYIYINRGLLAYLNSEAELAAVLAHEIGHVTARHAVRRYTTATLTGVVGAVVASQVGVQGAQDLANIMGTAVVRGYGRELELEADRFGAEYLARAGYDPSAMMDVLEILENQELFERQLAAKEGREPRIYHGLFSSHPDNDRRLQEVVQAARVPSPAQIPSDNRTEYLRGLDGLVFGDSEQAGIVRGNRVYHKDLGVALSFPTGWRVDNRPDRLLAWAPGNDGVIQVISRDLNQRLPPREFATRSLHLRDVRGPEEFVHHGMSGFAGIAPMTTPFGERMVRIVVLYKDDRAFVLAGAAKDAADPHRYDRETVETARSFHPLGESERPRAEPLRLRLMPASPDTRFAELARESSIPNEPEAQLRLLNGFYPTGEPEPGLLLKVVE